MNKTCIVVGGGVVGLLAAYLAKKNFENVILVERSSSIGGLLGSFEHEGALYDYGTHIPAITNINDLDHILFGSEQERLNTYHHFPYLRSENYFNSKWNLTSPLISTASLPEKIYSRGIEELLEAKGADQSETNLEKYLIDTFGLTFTREIYKPVFKKLLNEDLNNLHKNLLKTFGLQRLIALTPDATKQLKILPKYDNSLGFHSYTDGSPALPYCYPKGVNGIGFWGEQLLNKVLEAGVVIKTKDSISKINLQGASVRSVLLADNTEIKCDHVFWTVSPALALKSVGLEVKVSAPVFRTHTLCHFEFKKPLLKVIPQYLLCWDVDMISYRITLYPNITEDRAKVQKYNLTVEVLSDSSAAEMQEQISEKVLAELKTMNIVSGDNELLARKIEYMGNSFPILTEQFLRDAKELQNRVEEEFSNLTLLGRAAGTTFFINDLLVATYNKVNEIRMNCFNG